MKFRRRLADILFGLVFVAIGIGFLGNAFGVWNYSLFFKGWWSLFIIIPCLISIIKSGFKAYNMIALVIGVMFLLSELNVIPSDVILKMILPIILIAIGAHIIFRKRYSLQINEIKQNAIGTTRDLFAIFGSSSHTASEEEFFGGNAVAIFGSVELDLTSAIIEQDVVIHAVSIFGGVDITLPQGVKVKTTGVPIFGGFDNKFNSTNNKSAPTIYVESVCIFAGVDIK